MITRVCPNCGSSFECYRSDSKTYCSRKCAAIVTATANLGDRTQRKIPLVELTCSHCEKPITQPKKRADRFEHHFCSQRCWGDWLRTQGIQLGANNPNYKPKVQRQCERCGKTLQVHESQIANGEGRYCSRECKNQRIEKVCELCNNTYAIPANQAPRNRFCSKACVSEWQRQTWVGPNAPAWRGGHTPYYGPNWRNQRRAARKRDDFTCQRCGIAEERLYRNLDVHHIIPFRAFGIERYKEANRLANLISLCHLCHLTTEPRKAEAS